jgi:phosphatidylglycerophosphate synthase
MLNNIHRRTTRDLTAVAAVYLCVGSWLAWQSSPGTGIGVFAVAAGATALGSTCASILRRNHPACTPADRVTLVRAILVACCAVLAFTSLMAPPSPGVLLLVLGALAFGLDAVDGAVARRTRSASADGARLDTETDAALTLVLSFAAAAALGAWTLLIGLMYYAFTAAGRVRPTLRRTIPVSRGRKAIGALQPLALLFALLPGAPVAPKTTAVVLSLVLLAFSFARDIITLECLHRSDPAEISKADVG